MPIRQIFVSAILFLLIVILGGAWSQWMTQQRSNATIMSPNNTFTINSTGYSTNSKERFQPFSPREYVRIIHIFSELPR
ncbi:hypothetical protein D3C73_877990 [compost metagenome]